VLDRLVGRRGLVDGRAGGCAVAVGGEQVVAVDGDDVGLKCRELSTVSG
jgi:hypothetical protein